MNAGGGVNDGECYPTETVQLVSLCNCARLFVQVLLLDVMHLPAIHIKGIVKHCIQSTIFHLNRACSWKCLGAGTIHIIVRGVRVSLATLNNEQPVTRSSIAEQQQ